MTNYEKIKNMSIEEMVKFFTDSDDAKECLICKMCMYCAKTKYKDGRFQFVQCCDEEIECEKGIKEWLQADYDNYF
jgi:hypothetical protein